MKGSPAIVISDGTEDRKGRVVLISPHPEDGEPWTKAHFRNLFRWAAGHEPAETLDEKNARQRIKNLCEALGGDRWNA